MTNQPNLPIYNDDLAVFLADLRFHVASSQARIARELKLAHTTISRYEGDKIKPPLGYLALLIQRVGERFGVTATPHLLREINNALLQRYADIPHFRTWDEVVICAEAYLTEQRGELPDKSTAVWGEAPDVTSFIGRDQELGEIQGWMKDGRSRVIMILGMAGMGKTMLATKAAHLFSGRFDIVIWYTCRNLPSALSLIQDITTHLPHNDAVSSFDNLTEGLRELVKQMIQQRVLLVLDNLESIAEAPDAQLSAGYTKLLLSLVRERHQSLVLLTSREKPQIFNRLTQEDTVLKILTLKGMPFAHGHALVKHAGVSGTNSEWKILIERYSGNPLALKLTAQTVNQLFNGNLTRFLNSETTIFEDIRILLDDQINRLPPLGVHILYWLAFVRIPVTFEALNDDLFLAGTTGECMDALKALTRQTLIENKQSLFFLQNVVLEYVTERLVRKICHEVETMNPYWLYRIPLLQATGRENIRQAQTRFLLQPITDYLLQQWGKERLEERLHTLHQLLRKQPKAHQGYAIGSLFNLRRHLGFSVSRQDFSNQTVWSAYLRGYGLQEVNFAHADLSRSVFDNSFIGVNTLALSPNGQLLAVATGSEIRIWQLKTSQVYQVLRGHTQLVWSLAFGADNQTLYSSGEDKVIRCWDVHLGQCIRTIFTGTQRIWGMSSDPTRHKIATGGANGEVYIWDAQNGKMRNMLLGHTQRVRALAFSPRAALLAAGDEKGDISLWDLETDQRLALIEAHDKQVTCLQFTADGQTLISGAQDKLLKQWDVNTAEKITKYTGHEKRVAALQIVPHKAQILSSGYDRTIRLWDMKTGTQLAILRGHTHAIGSLALDAQGQLLASGSYDRSARLWDMNTLQTVDQIKGKTFEVLCLAYDDTEQFLASGGADYRIRIWQTAESTPKFTLEGHRRWVSAVAFHPHRPQLASGSYDRTIRLWDMVSGTCKHKLEGHTFWVLCLAYHPDGHLIASGGSDNLVMLWDTTSSQHHLTLTGHEDEVTCLAFGSQFLASGSRDGTIILWDIHQGAQIAMWATEQTNLKQLVIASDEQHLVAITAAGDVSLWRLLDHERLQQYQVDPGHRLSAVAGSRLVVVQDDQLQLWEAAVKTAQIDWRPLTSPSTMTISPSGSQVAIGYLDGSIDSWNIPALEPSNHYQLVRPYEGTNITGIEGVNRPQIEMLKALGAQATD